MPALAVTPREAAARHALESCQSVNERKSTAINGSIFKATATAESQLVIFIEDHCTLTGLSHYSDPDPAFNRICELKTKRFTSGFIKTAPPLFRSGADSLPYGKL